MDKCHVAGSCQPNNGTCTNPTGNDGVSCGSNLVCANGGCSTQITVTPTAVTATQGIGFSGNVANVTDTVTSEAITASINWGDGTAASAGTVSGGGGAFIVSGSHTYAQGATATSGTVTISASNGNQASAFFNVTLKKVTISEYTNSTMNGPWGIVLGPDGNIWFTQFSYVGKITPTGTITQYQPPSEAGGVFLNSDITFGSDGIWFAESKVASIASVTTSGTIAEYLSGYHGPTGIATGSDGNIWFIDKNPTTTYYVVRAYVPPAVSTDFTTYTVSGYSSVIAPGPDGALWFTQPSASTIGRITTAGAITTPTSLAANSTPSGIVAGPDGALWFTEFGANKIGRITTAGGTPTEYTIPTNGSQPTGICVGPDNQLWFTESGGNQIGRITTQGVIAEFAIPTPGSSPARCATGSDGALWFTENAGNKIGKLVLP